MKFSLTSIVYLPVSVSIAIVAFRFYRAWKVNRSHDTLIYAFAFLALSLVCLAGVLTTIFPSPEGIRLLLIISNVLLSISNAFFAYLFIYYRFPKLSPWFAFSAIVLLGAVLTVFMFVSPINPTFEAEGGINWGLPLPIGIMRTIIYLLGMVPLSVHILEQLKFEKNKNQISINLFLLVFFGLTLIVVIFDFLIEPIFQLEAHLSEILILVLAVVGMLIYFYTSENIFARIERKFKNLVDNMIDLVCLLDQKGEIRYANPAFQKILNYKSTKLTGKKIFDLIHPEDQTLIRQKFNELTAQNLSGTFEFRFLNKEKQIVWVESSGFFLLDPQVSRSEDRQIVISCQDITHRKSLEENLRQAQKMEAIGLLAGGIAHDFNNLLTVINGYTDLALLKLDLNHPLYASLKQVREAGERASSLTRQLLTFSRKHIQKTEIFNVNDLIKNMNKMLRRLIKENIELKNELDSSILMIEADPAQIEQVILNLVVNARDALPEGGQISIKTRNVFFNKEDLKFTTGIKPGNFVMISVSDNGIGMDKETKERIFEPFFTTKKEGQGTGLGLATVYGIVNQSKGFIRVISEPGKGTIFEAFFPGIKPTDAVSKKQQTKVEITGNETILIVEDEEPLRIMVKNTLEAIGYTTYNFTNGQEAFEFVKKEHPKIDLLLTDVIMPKMNGPELAKKLKKLYPKLNIVFMSGYPGNGISEKEIFKMNFIQKPFSVQDLAKKIKEVLK